MAASVPAGVILHELSIGPVINQSRGKQVLVRDWEMLFLGNGRDTTRKLSARVRDPAIF